MIWKPWRSLQLTELADPALLPSSTVAVTM